MVPALCSAQDENSDLTNSAGHSGSIGTAFTTLVASCPFDVCWIDVELIDGRYSGVVEIIDLALGASGSEVIVANSLVGYGGVFAQARFSFPLTIPAGSRISARVTTGSVGNAIVRLYAGAFDAEGASGLNAENVTATSNPGTAITPNAAAATKGSFAQLVSATAKDYCGFILIPDGQNNTTSNTAYFMDLAIGPSGSEQIIMSNLLFRSTSPSPSDTPFLPIQIPAGTRLSARCSCDIASGAAIGISFYGVYK